MMDNKANHKQKNILLVNYKTIRIWLSYLFVTVNNHLSIIEFQHAKPPLKSFKYSLNSALCQHRRLTPQPHRSGPVAMATAKGHLCPMAVPGSGSRRATFSFLFFYISLFQKVDLLKWNPGRMFTLAIVGQGNTTPAQRAPGFRLAGCRRQGWSTLVGTPKSPGSRRWKSLHQHAEPTVDGRGQAFARHQSPPRTNVAITSRVTAG